MRDKKTRCTISIFAKMAGLIILGLLFFLRTSNAYAAQYTPQGPIAVPRIAQTHANDCNICSLASIQAFMLGQYSYTPTQNSDPVNGRPEYKDVLLSRTYVAPRDYSQNDDPIWWKLYIAYGCDNAPDYTSSLYPSPMVFITEKVTLSKAMETAYAQLSSGLPVHIYTGSHASIIIGYRGKTDTLRAEDFTVMEIKPYGNGWKNNATYFNLYASNPSTYYSSSVEHCYVTLSAWLKSNGGSIKVISYPANRNPKWVTVSALSDCKLTNQTVTFDISSNVAQGEDGCNYDLYIWDSVSYYNGSEGMLVGVANGKAQYTFTQSGNYIVKARVHNESVNIYSKPLVVQVDGPTSTFADIITQHAPTQDNVSISGIITVDASVGGIMFEAYHDLSDVALYVSPDESVLGSITSMIGAILPTSSKKIYVADFTIPSPSITVMSGKNRYQYDFLLSDRSQLLSKGFGSSITIIPSTTYYYRYLYKLNDESFMSELYSFTTPADNNPGDTFSVTWSNLHTDDPNYGLFNAQVNWGKSLTMNEVGCFVSTDLTSVKNATRNSYSGCAMKKDTSIIKKDSLTTDSTYGTIVFYKGPGFGTISGFTAGTTYYYKFYSITSDGKETHSAVASYTPAGSAPVLSRVWMTPDTNTTVRVGDKITFSYGADQAADFYFHSLNQSKNVDDCIVREQSATAGSYQYQFNTVGTFRVYIGAGHSSGDKYSNEILVTVKEKQGKLKVEGLLDGLQSESIKNYGTFDVYIDGTLQASGRTNYEVEFDAGTKYQIKNIKAANGKTYQGNTSYSGTIKTGATSKVTLQYSTNGAATTEWQTGTVVPGNLDPSTLDIEYKHYYEKVSATSPGAGWVEGSVSNSYYENTGGIEEYPYEKATSDTYVYVGEYYYHWCGTNNDCNYEKTPGKYETYHGPNPVGQFDVVKTGTDTNNSNIKWYQLKWKAGLEFSGLATCATNQTANWYKKYKYQPKVLVTEYNWTKESDWVTALDSTANSHIVRWRLKGGIPLDTACPVIKTAKIQSYINEGCDGYKVYVKASDNKALSKIYAGTWNDATGKSKIKWQSATVSGTSAEKTFNVKVSDFSNARNTTYHTEVYAVDTAGNECEKIQAADYYVAQWYTLTKANSVNDQTEVITPGYPAGTEVPITADAIDGYVFDHWICDKGTIKKATSASTVFVMPQAAATLTCVYKKIECTITIDGNTMPDRPCLVYDLVQDGASVPFAISYNTNTSGLVNTLSVMAQTWDFNTSLTVNQSAKTLTFHGSGIANISAKAGEYGGSNWMFLVMGNDTLRIPQGTTTIEEEAFANTKASIVVIPDSVTSIGSKAFTNAKIVLMDTSISRDIAADAFPNLFVYAETGTQFNAALYQNFTTGLYLVSRGVELPATTAKLDVSGSLDGTNVGNTRGYGTFDVYIDGKLLKDDVDDINASFPLGTSYQITDIKPAEGHQYNGVVSGSLEGVIRSTKSIVIRLSFSTIK